MSINWSQIITTLEHVASFVEQAAPLASVVGPEGAVIGKLVSTGAQLASVALDGAQDETALISAPDLASVQALQARIEAANDAPGAQVDNS